MHTAIKSGSLALAALTLTTCAAMALDYQINSGPVMTAPAPGPVYEQAPPDVTINAPQGLDLTFELAKPVQVNTPNLPGTTPPTLKKRSLTGGNGQDLVVAVSCEVAGAANALSDDLMLVNRGTATLEAGTTIKWKVRSTRLEGFFALNKAIAAGQGFRASDILGRSVEAGAPCTAKIV